MSLIGIFVALIIVGVLLRGINAVLGVLPVPEPFRTILWVIVVSFAVLTFVDIAGLYHFNIR